MAEHDSTDAGAGDDVVPAAQGPSAQLPPRLANDEQRLRVIEAALLTAGEPVGIDRLLGVLDDPALDRVRMRGLLQRLGDSLAGRGMVLAEVAGGFRLQVPAELAPWMARLQTERPPRYSRALLETLVVIAYRQPVTRGDIEDVRGVAVATTTIRTLLDRGWIRVVGQRDVPGRPSLYGTTREFLDYFSLRALADLPPLAELSDAESLEPQLSFDELAPPPLARLALPDDDHDGDGDGEDDADDALAGPHASPPDRATIHSGASAAAVPAPGALDALDPDPGIRH